MAASGKTDMERIGLFSEVGYTTIGDQYPKTDSNGVPFNEAANKGKQMLPGGSKTRSALQAGYFDNQFKRIMEREAYSDQLKLRRQERLIEAAKNKGKAFLPNDGGKRPCGRGSHYGTFSGPISAFSPVLRSREAYVSPGKNFHTSPPRKGTGYGYVGITLGKYQEHAAESYNGAKDMRRKDIAAHKTMLQGSAFKLNLHPQTYFDQNPYKSDKPPGPSRKGSAKPNEFAPFKPSSPAKKIGGAKAGTFDAYPSHSEDPYVVKPKKQPTTNKDGKIFHPAVGPKSRPTKSVVAQNVMKAVHRDNYKNVQQVMAF